jgi:hypothetical protein
MKSRVALGVVLLMLVAAVLAACSASTTPTGSVATPAGQVAMPASQVAMSTDQYEVVHVTVYDYKMDMSHTTFSAGTPYHFVVANRSTLSQECLILPHEMGQAHKGDLRHQALVTTHLMMPGETKAFDYTFPLSTAPQQVDFACYSNGHATMSKVLQVR